MPRKHAKRAPRLKGLERMRAERLNDYQKQRIIESAAKGHKATTIADILGISATRIGTFLYRHRQVMGR